MNLCLHFILINSEFNRQIANDFYGGQESEDNIKHLWEDELEVMGNVKDFKIKNNAIYHLKGYKGKELFDYEIPDMTVCECFTTGGDKMEFAVSKKLLKKTEKIVKGEDIHLYFYLRDHQPMENPMDGVYILKKDFPKALKKPQ